MILLVQSSSCPQQHIATVPWYTSKECSSPALPMGTPCAAFGARRTEARRHFQRGCKFYRSILEAYSGMHLMKPRTCATPLRSSPRADYRFGCNRMMTVPSKTLTNAALREPQPSSQFHDHFRIGDRSFQGAHEAAGAARKAQKCPARRSAAGHQHSEEEEFGAYEDAPHDWAHAAC